MYLWDVKQFPDILKELRIQKKVTIKEAAKATKIEYSLFSRFENGDRIPTKTQIGKIARYYKVPQDQLLIPWLGLKIYKEIANEDLAIEALMVAEDMVGYKRHSPENHDLIVKIDALKKELDKHRPIPASQLKKLLEYYKVEYTYDSNRIEGNTLTLQETALVIEKGMTISGKSVQEHFEAVNHAEAIDMLFDLVKKKEALSEYILKQIHALVLRGIDKDNAGRYRHINVRISGSRYMPPEHFAISRLMEEYFAFYEENRHKLHPVILAAEMHERLVTIHPFVDGNGRTARLIMNLVLLQAGYTITNISGERANRLNYYQCLETAQVEHNKKPFLEFVAGHVVRNLEDFIKLIR